MLPVPKWLSNADLMKTIKDTLATIEWAGAILNIINMNTLNYPKVEAKEHTPRPERSSFWPKRETSYGNKGWYWARPSSNSFDSRREDKPYRDRPQREDRPSNNSYGSKRDDSRWWFRGKPKSWGGYSKSSGWSYSKWWDRWSRPSRPR